MISKRLVNDPDEIQRLEAEVDERLARVAAAQKSSQLFTRTRLLDYTARRETLSSRANGGEPAIVLDPIESPLWFVSSPDGFLSDPVNTKDLIRLAAEVIDWTNEVVTGVNGATDAIGAHFVTGLPPDGKDSAAAD